MIKTISASEEIADLIERIARSSTILENLKEILCLNPGFDADSLFYHISQGDEYLSLRHFNEFLKLIYISVDLNNFQEIFGTEG